MTFQRLALLAWATYAQASDLAPRLENGLARTPPMGWNSYNAYSCSPTEAIIKSNAQALVSLGLKDVGYYYVTPDCGWTLAARKSDGTLTWNTNLFPAGFPALATFVHNLGLGFGVYSDAGVKMCSTSAAGDQVGSLGHEDVDAKTFASWGADLVKYDDCYSEPPDYPNVDYTPSSSPSPRMSTMSKALLNTGRKILFAVCEWGVDFPSAWAPAIGNTWRITNDIIPSWKTIYRIVNQAVPSTSFAAPGRWPDLDMMLVGNKIFTTAEEQTHFSLWAILKSPLIIGAALPSIPSSSVTILKNTRAISYNQDSLGVAANLTRRYTEEGLDVWSGPLSNGRTVVALVNWNNKVVTGTLNLPDIGIQSASTLYDVWAATSRTNVKTSYTASIAAHGTALLELGGTTVAGDYYADLFATTSGKVTTFTGIYGISTSANNNIVLNFPTAPTAATTVSIVSSTSPNTPISVSIAAGAKTATAKIPLTASNSNTLTLTFSSDSAIPISTIRISKPVSTFYPANSFTLKGQAKLAICSQGCLPIGNKLSNLNANPAGSATISLTRPSDSLAGSKYVEITYINNEVSLDTSWGDGRNARNVTVSVNSQKATRLEVPLSGKSSELFSPGYGWYDAATLGVLVTGFGAGSGADSLEVGNVGGSGVVLWGADVVGVRVYW